MIGEEKENIGYVRQMAKVVDDEDVDPDELKDTAGVKTIRLQEDIKRIFTSKNTSQYSYLAIIGV